MNEKRNNFIKGYVRERGKVILTFFMVNMIYFIVYKLYRVPSYAFRYALILSVFLGTVMMIVDYSRLRKKHEALEMLKNAMDLKAVQWVKAEGTIERDYQRLMEHLNDEITKLIQERDERSSNQLNYLTMWTHQIKTPVAALHLLVTNLPYSAEKLSLEEELFRVEEYIAMVLQYLRMDTMTSDLLLKEYDLYSMVKQAVKKYSILFIHKHLSLDFQEFSCNVITDEKWVVFVIEQIISNALKYTKEGSIRIYPESEDSKVLVIEDTGIGIRPEDVKRVFERGYTGYNGRFDKKSTGIGMYLCKTILDKLGHKISIESVLGIGTKVKIDFMEYKIDPRD